jgi:hypothetical protein
MLCHVFLQEAVSKFRNGHRSPVLIPFRRRVATPCP